MTNRTALAGHLVGELPCNVINGSRSPACGTDVILKRSPRDGGVLYEFKSSDSRDVDRAVECARAAFDDGRWSKRAVQYRKDVLLKLAKLVEDSGDELAMLECLDLGKPIMEARKFDIPAAAATLRFNAEAADKIASMVYSADHCSLSYDLLRPMG